MWFARNSDSEAAAGAGAAPAAGTVARTGVAAAAPAVATVAAAALLGLLACGGGSGGGGGTPTEPTTGAIRGTVTEEGGGGIAGAAVGLRAPDGGTDSETTDGSGAYRFDALAAGQYTLTLTVPTGFTLAAGQAAERQVAVTAGGTQTVDYRLQAEAGGEFTVVDLTAGLSFSPQEVRISVGERVRWVNRADVLHTVTPDGHEEWTEVTLDEAGESFEHVFAEPGTYPYFCVPHRGSGMTGTIIVE